MCETMASIPMEDRPSCVLTEDMFDAAMNQQFAYQNDIESEEELSSQDDNMEVDQDTQESSQDSSENVVETDSAQCNITSLSKENTSSYDSPAVSVLVIETGLDKSKEHSDTCEETVSKDASADLVNNVDSNGCIKINDGFAEDKQKQSQTDFNSNETEEDKDADVRKLPILKKILSSDTNVGTIESIDLCDSDSEFSAEEELPGVELIDDELKSVMENNLMAEIGMNVSKQKVVEPVANKTVETSPSKIAVKSMAQIPSNIFNAIPQKTINNGTSITELVSSTSTCSNKNVTNGIGSVKSLTEMSKEEIPTTIHINRIAVPHQTLVNSQGQKMKYVYVRSRSSVPFVINSNQATSNSGTPKYVMASQIKKGLPKQMPPITALANMNMTLKNMNQKKTILTKMPSKMLNIAPKFQKPPVLKNAPSRPYQFHLEQNADSLIKSLLFHNLKKPYKPPDELIPSMATFICTDCSDRFVLQSSLNQHLGRRSLSICYWCRICKVQLQFFNRCVFLKHLRGHNCSITNVDTTCITFSPLSKEMIDSGIASSFLKESSSDLSAQESILKKNTKSIIENNDLSKKLSNSNGLSEKPNSAVTLHNPSIKKVTTEAGQAKCVSFQPKVSVIPNKPITSPAITSLITSSVVTSQASPRSFPQILPKTPQIPTVVPNTQKQPKDKTIVTNQENTNKSLLVCNSLPGSDNIKHVRSLSSSTANVLDTECRDIDDDVVVDEDTEKTNEYQEEEEIDVENVTENNALLCADTKTKQKTKRREKSSSTSLRRYCGECGTSCVNINKHLSGSSRPTNPKLACDVCKLVLPTRCALKIHLRIHMKLPPYKCPDCGKDFNSWDEVNAHLKFSCGHLAKCVRYLCTSCKAHFASPVHLGNHILSTHARDIYKCTSCPVAFFNKDSLKKHLSTIHPNELVEGTDYKQCSLCPKKLVPTDQFISHVQEHTKTNNVLMYGWKCPMCFIVFANKMTFIIHQIKEKREIEAKGGMTNTKSKTSYNMPVPPDQEVNSLSDSDIEEEPVIVRKYPGPEDFLEPSEKDPLSLDGWEHTQEHQVNEKREELCIVCKTNAVVILPGIDLNEQSLCCKQCVKPLDFIDSRTQSNRSILNYNNRLDKSMKRKKSTPKGVQRSYSCDDVNSLKKKRKSNEQEFAGNEFTIDHSLDMGLIKKKNRKKQHKDKVLVGNGHAHIQGQVVSSKSPDELICAKCKFVADTRETFLEHIAIHRTDPNTFQCMECGLCFVVLPSLERHLQINHGIKDINIYTKNNLSSLPEKFVSFEEEPDDNQCRVCNEMFDSSSSLEKHFRSHGMAFMNSLTKSP